MAEIKELKPNTKRKPKPEKPAEVVDIESRRKKKLIEESTENQSLTFDNAFDLVERGQLSDEEIDNLRQLNNEERVFLKSASSLFQKIKERDGESEETEELRKLIKNLKQRLEERQT